MKIVFPVQQTLLSQKNKVSFRSIKHSIHTITNTEIALHKFNDKGIVDEDGGWKNNISSSEINCAIHKLFL